MKAGDVVKKISKNTSIKNFNHYDHKCLYFLFSIRPISEEKLDEFKTNIKYCHYDEVHGDYVYQESWPKFIVNLINNNLLTKAQWGLKFKAKDKLNIIDFT